ncbi:MAG: hypothetical protein ACTSSI_03560 [Candidatus Helarchaeota archaeon]
MVFQLVDYLTSTALWIVLIILLLGVCSVFFYIKSYKGEGIQKQIFFGYGLFFTCYGITRIFFFLESMFPRQTFPSELFTVLGSSVIASAMLVQYSCFSSLKST